MANDNWVEIKPKRRQRINLGKPLQGNPKDFNAGALKKEAIRKDQGHPIQSNLSNIRMLLNQSEDIRGRNRPDG